MHTIYISFITREQSVSLYRGAVLVVGFLVLRVAALGATEGHLVGTGAALADPSLTGAVVGVSEELPGRPAPP